MKNLRPLTSLSLLIALAIPAAAQQPAPAFSFTFVGAPKSGVTVANLGGTYQFTVSGTSQTVVGFPDGTSQVQTADLFYIIAKNGVAVAPQQTDTLDVTFGGATTGIVFLIPGNQPPDYSSTHTYNFTAVLGRTADRLFSRSEASNDSRDFDNRVVSAVNLAPAPEPSPVLGLSIGLLGLTALVVRRRSQLRLSK